MSSKVHHEKKKKGHLDALRTFPSFHSVTCVPHFSKDITGFCLGPGKKGWPVIVFNSFWCIFLETSSSTAVISYAIYFLDPNLSLCP